jgi:hypothetical protein
MKLIIKIPVFTALIALGFTSCKKSQETSQSAAASDTSAASAPSVTKRSTYSVTIEKGLTKGVVERTKTTTLSLNTLSNGSMEIQQQESGKGMLSLASTQVSVVGDHPPYNGILLAAILPNKGDNLSANQQWDSQYPSDSMLALEQDKFSLQDHYSMKVIGKNGANDVIGVHGEVRIVPNKYAQQNFSDAGKSDHAYNFRPFLEGVAEYDPARKMIVKYETNYVLFPESGLTSDKIRSNQHLQHVTFTLHQ